MKNKKALEPLQSNIECDRVIVHNGGDFFHNHDGYELFLLLEGELNYYIEQVGSNIKRGNLVCIKPYDFHTRDVIDKNSYDRIVINIKEAYMKQLSSNKTDLSKCFYNPASKSNILQLDEQEIAEYSLCAHRLSQALDSDEFGSDILADAYTKQILVIVNRLSNNKKRVGINNIMPRLVSGTIAYIEQHLTEEITLDILAEHFHHNGTYMSRCFKNITGISLHQYIIRKRISLAKKYLNEGCSPIDACYLSGFNDYSNFSRTFTKHVGESPKKFQQIGQSRKLWERETQQTSD